MRQFLHVFLWMLLGTLALSVCQVADAQVQQSQDQQDQAAEVDALQSTVVANKRNLKELFKIDHCRLAKKSGVTMPPCVVTLFSDPAINTPLIMANPRVGVDLPIKVLAYSEVGGRGPSVAFVTPEFLEQRHAGINREQCAEFERALNSLLTGIPDSQRSPISLNGVTSKFGLIELTSEFPPAETEKRIKAAVLEQGDTVWFGELDYQRDAAALGTEIPFAKLLLFGGPGPGGKAMAEYPKLGLDAFCQKLLVFEDDQGQLKVAFNDIVAFAKLHYGGSNGPQKIINGRLKKTISTAIKK